MSSHQQRELTTHVVNWLAKVCLSNLVKLSGAAPCPELDSGIPSTTDNYSLPILIEVVYVLDGLSVLTDRRDLIGRQVPLLDIVIGACKEDGRLIDAPAHTKDGRSRIILQHHLLLDLGRAHAALLSLINNHVSIPKGCEKKAMPKLLIGLV